ncbi:MAG: FtsL-like putative cell division protein [Cytophagales bacterium]|nr:FtsL-like putative cell division protein [Cytophagales bacterium]
MPNTIKNSTENKPKSKSKGLFASIGSFFKLGNTFEDGVPVHYLPKLLWVTVLVILYISNAHYAEKTTRKIDRLKYELEDLRTEYTTIKAGYMYDSKQSEVAKKVAPLGLVESKKPPMKIKIDL